MVDFMEVLYRSHQIFLQNPFFSKTLFSNITQTPLGLVVEISLLQTYCNLFDCRKIKKVWHRAHALRGEQQVAERQEGVRGQPVENW